MGISLGAGAASRLVVTAKNSDSVTLQKGMVVNFVIAANFPALVAYPTEQQVKDYGSGNIEIMPDYTFDVIRATLDNTGKMSGSACLGVVTQDIPVGKLGHVCVYGMCQVMWIGTLTASAGAVISAAGSGKVGPAATPTNVNPVGLILQAATATADLLYWAWVNRLHTGIPGTAAFSQSTTFYGKTY